MWTEAQICPFDGLFFFTVKALQLHEELTISDVIASPRQSGISQLLTTTDGLKTEKTLCSKPQTYTQIKCTFINFLED